MLAFYPYLMPLPSRGLWQRHNLATLISKETAGARWSNCQKSRTQTRILDHDIFYDSERFLVTASEGRVSPSERQAEASPRRLFGYCGISNGVPPTVFCCLFQNFFEIFSCVGGLDLDDLFRHTRGDHNSSAVPAFRAEIYYII